MDISFPCREKVLMLHCDEFRSLLGMAMSIPSSVYKPLDEYRILRVSNSPHLYELCTTLSVVAQYLSLCTVSSFTKCPACLENHQVSERWLWLMWEKILEQGRGKERKRVVAATVRVAEAAARATAREDEGSMGYWQLMEAEEGAAVIAIEEEEGSSVTISVAEEAWLGSAKGATRSSCGSKQVRQQLGRRKVVAVFPSCLRCWQQGGKGQWLWEASDNNKMAGEGMSNVATGGRRLESAIAMIAMAGEEVGLVRGSRWQRRAWLGAKGSMVTIVRAIKTAASRGGKRRQQKTWLGAEDRSQRSRLCVGELRQWEVVAAGQRNKRKMVVMAARKSHRWRPAVGGSSG
ncbi:hypothetical protein B296_00021257 [Ensete ventricosum]|uniref:Uncharacterized protein n=1 Tax=Ensete ventricosum TaxID=4639 RepID=A0A426YEH3_ENSVE|nr:hypothetical protein B296_00021257 [Ensete ventricosum]